MPKQFHLASAILCLMLVSNACIAQSTLAPPPTADSDKTSEQAPEETSSEQTAPSAKKQKKICKSSAPTGSRIGKKTCLTKAAWDEMGRKARTTLDASTRPTSNNKQGE